MCYTLYVHTWYINPIGTLIMKYINLLNGIIILVGKNRYSLKIA